MVRSAVARQQEINVLWFTYNPYKWYGRKAPLKMFQKFFSKFNKAVQSNILRLNWNYIFEYFTAVKQGTPSFHIHAPGSKRRYPCTQTKRLSQNSSPICSNFLLVVAPDMHLEPDSETRMENVGFHTATTFQAGQSRSTRRHLPVIIIIHTHTQLTGLGKLLCLILSSSSFPRNPPKCSTSFQSDEAGCLSQRRK